MRRVHIIALLAAAASVAAPASAETNVWQTGGGFTIKTGDIDRTTSAGRATLLKRVEFAAKKLCTNAKPRVAFDACVARSTERTIAAGPEPMRRSLKLAIDERAGKEAWARR